MRFMVGSSLPPVPFILHFLELLHGYATTCLGVTSAALEWLFKLELEILEV